MWDEDEEAESGKQKTPKQRLLGWIQNKLPELPITNFHRDWQTGRALGALVDSCAPGECIPLCSWDRPWVSGGEGRGGRTREGLRGRTRGKDEGEGLRGRTKGKD